jgi:hypothetical protein
MGRDARYLLSDEAVEFKLLVSGRTFEARVTRQALEKRFGASSDPESLIAAYRQNAPAIDSKAAEKIRAGQQPPVQIDLQDL